MSEQKQIDLKEVKITVDGVFFNNLILDLGNIPAKFSKGLIDYLEGLLNKAINDTYAPQEESKEDNRIKLEEFVEEVKE